MTGWPTPGAAPQTGPASVTAPAWVGDGNVVAAGLPLQAATSRRASAARALGMRIRDRTGTLLPNAARSVSATQWDVRPTPPHASGEVAAKRPEGHVRP